MLRIFTFGTLKRGQPNNYLLERSKEVQLTVAKEAKNPTQTQQHFPAPSDDCERIFKYLLNPESLAVVFVGVADKTLPTRLKCR